MRFRVIFPIIILLTSGLVWFASDPILRVLQAPNTDYGSIILRDRNGTILTNKSLSGGYMIPYEGSLTGRLFDAIIATEDRRYREHSGVDIWAKVAGIFDNIQAGSVVRGSSTITEQYVKNAYYRTSERTLWQKIREAIAATTIELTTDKDTILRHYLDHIYFGNRLYGLEAALRIYYPGRTPEMLTDDEILDLITRIHRPSITRENIESARIYRESVAKKLGWTSGTDRLLRDLNFPFLDMFPLMTLRVQKSIDAYCHGEKQALEKWVPHIPDHLCASNNTDLILSVDLGLMRMITSAIEQSLSTLADENVSNAAVYIYDPTHAKVLVYVANRAKNRDVTAIDMITERRSVGSILKPWIYLLALRDGAEGESLILDDTRVYPTGVDGKSFVPMNYSPRSYGPIPLREALGNSLNSATVRLSEQLGIERIAEFLRENGLQLDHDAGYYGYGIALGNIELTLQNMVESYAQLTKVSDPDIFLIEKILSNPMNRARAFGISSILNSTLSLPVKTGTSTDFRDNWTISYHPDAVIGVWVGNANSSSMQDISGISGAGPLWHTIAEYMTTHEYLRPWAITVPLGVHETSLCLDTRCMKRSRTWMKNPESIKSRSDSHLYFLSDFVGPITDEEKKKWNIE